MGINRRSAKNGRWTRRGFEIKKSLSFRAVLLGYCMRKKEVGVARGWKREVDYETLRWFRRNE
ncbi:unnamed protein product [Fusarium venenatum]|uniref:Uncharacterized protein n=1 Tax=Fusarium venenatum TaxID=56646 RepID=A0A2L2TN48_9HYPO|nr:uncharacterized protein FVRRES_05151 [Fusarium venenatum]CEI60715.1 unnamed protein product [Fusarium venenatum]